jgi:predicted deacetylase
MAIHSPAGPTLSAPVSSGGRRLAVSFHGLAPHTQRPCQELLALLAELGVPRASLLVVPRWQGTESILERPFFLRWLLSLTEEGHEVCLYGRTGRSAAEIREGSEILAAAGLRPQGFAAPVRQLSPEDRNLLRGLGLAYSVGVRHLYLLGACAAGIVGMR